MLNTKRWRHKFAWDNSMLWMFWCFCAHKKHHVEIGVTSMGDPKMHCKKCNTYWNNTP